MIRATNRLAALLILVFPAASRGEGEGAPRPALVSHDALQERLGGANLRLLDARSKAEYEKGHIPGAVWVDAKAAQTLAARPGGLTDRASWEAWLAPLGIAPGARSWFTTTSGSVRRRGSGGCSATWASSTPA